MSIDSGFADGVAGLLGTGKPKFTIENSITTEEIVTSPVQLDAPLFGDLLYENTSSICTMDHDGVSDKLTTRRAREAVRKRKYHQRLKNEREDLRRTAEELTLQLQELQTDKNNGEKHLVINSGWKTIALKQRDRRLKAESEHVQLFAAAKTQASAIQKLCEQLPARSATMVIEASNNKALLGDFDNHYPVNSPPFDHLMYNALMRRVNESYAEIEAIMGEFGIADGATFSRRQRSEDGEIDYFEHLNKITEPFSYEQTCNAICKLTSLQHRQQDREEFLHLASLDDTVFVRFRLVRELKPGSRVSVLQRYMNRRFLEQNRTVFVWKTLSEGEGVFHGMYSDETGWLCMEPSSEEGATLIRICVRQTPMCLTLPNQDNAIAEDFYRVLQSSIREDMYEISTALDKMLLDDTLAGIDI